MIIYNSKILKNIKIDTKMHLPNQMQMKQFQLAQAKVLGKDIVVAIFEFDFLGGSMGAVVGKRFTKAVDYAVEHNFPLVAFSTSGGARMQES